MEVHWTEGTALHRACADYDVDAVAALATTRDVDGRADPGRWTPLMMACLAFSWEWPDVPDDDTVVAVVRRLLAAGADATLVDAAGGTALAHACAANLHGAARCLADAHPGGLASRDVFGWTPLHCALAMGHGEALRALLDPRAAHRADVNAATPPIPKRDAGLYAEPHTSDTGESPTHTLVARGRVGLLALLLRVLFF